MEASVFSAAPSDHLPTAKRSCRPESRTIFLLRRIVQARITRTTFLLRRDRAGQNHGPSSYCEEIVQARITRTTFLLRRDRAGQNHKDHLPTAKRSCRPESQGPPSYCEEIVQARITRIRESLAALHDMQDSQLETTLLRSCLALPKFSYILRTSPPSYIEQAARDFDVAVRETLEVILGCPLSEWSWLKASLPSSGGGINLRSASLHAPAAFLASSCSQELVGKMLGCLPSRSPTSGLPSLPSPIPPRDQIGSI